MNRSTVSSPASSWNVSRSEAARPPAEPAASRDGKSSTNGHSSREATALAKLVLPVPGGPKRMTAFGGVTPYRSASAGSASGSTIRRSMVSFSRSIPARAVQSPPGCTRPPSSASRPASLAPRCSTFS